MKLNDCKSKYQNNIIYKKYRNVTAVNLISYPF